MTNKIHLGDCLDTLKNFEDNSVDSIVTDPPYGFSFMGKDWDKAVPSINIWKECIRVLKPGAFAFIMSSPRQDVLSRMIFNLQEAGFKTDFTSIYWTYASGFPKALNIGKKLDKYAGRQNETLAKIKDDLAMLYDLSGKSITQINRECGFNAGGYLRKEHRADDSWGIALPTVAKWEIIKKVINCPENNEVTLKLKETFKSAEREVIGKKKSGLGTGNQFAFYEDNKLSSGETDITLPATDKAKQFEGSYSGFQPKPAVEIIIVVMKPLSEGGYSQQALVRSQEEENILDDISKIMKQQYGENVKWE